MKKIIAMILVIALTAAISVGATMAYLTDTDEDVNVMTLGNVKIEQHEYERVVDANGDPVLGTEGVDFDANYGISQSYKLQPFTQAKPAYPAVYTKGTTAWDEFQQLWNQIGAPGSNDLFDDSMKNVIDKFVFVENTGKSDAYYRTIIAIEIPEGLSANAIHTSFNGTTRFDYNSDEDGAQDASKANKFFTEIDGVRYVIYTATYTQVLTPGEISRPSLLQVFLDPAVTNEDCALFGNTWEILAVTQAVQTAGFADAQTALDTAFGAITTTNHPWIDGVTLPGVVEDGGSVSADPAPYEGGMYDEGTNTVSYKDVVLTGNTYILIDKNAPVAMENVSANVNGSVIVMKDNDPAIYIKDSEFTIDNGEYLIDASAFEGGVYQIFLVNVKVNGEYLTQETAAQYLNNVNWYQALVWAE